MSANGMSAPTAAPGRPLSSENVGFHPPDHLPSQTTPASENAAMLFERS